MNNILVQEEYGFRTHSSTEQAAFTFINSFLTAINNNKMVGGMFCDLQKAFDCVNHKILLEKVEFYGVEEKLETLIESYLTGRYHRVALFNITNNNNSSKWELLKCGMPQGSILGPLFFLIYINDLPTRVNTDNNMLLFADDTRVLIIVNSCGYRSFYSIRFSFNNIPGCLHFIARVDNSLIIHTLFRLFNDIS